MKIGDELWTASFGYVTIVDAFFSPTSGAFCYQVKDTDGTLYYISSEDLK